MGSKTVIYARVSTNEQDVEHQKNNLWEYATDDLGVDGSEIEVLSDKSTGTDIDRSGYRKMMNMVRSGEAERVVTREVTRLGRTMREISENVHEIVEDHGAGLNVMNDDLDIETDGDLSMNEKMYLNVLAWSAELEAKKIKENTIAGLEAAKEQGKWVGRPPYGFSTDDEGYLQPTKDFHKAVQAIRAVEDKDWSERKVARHTGVPRRTIPNILDNKDMYLSELDN